MPSGGVVQVLWRCSVRLPYHPPLVIIITGAGEDHGIDHNKNLLRFPYDSTFLRSHYLHPHPYHGQSSGWTDHCQRYVLRCRYGYGCHGAGSGERARPTRSTTRPWYSATRPTFCPPASMPSTRHDITSCDAAVDGDNQQDCPRQGQLTVDIPLPAHTLPSAIPSPSIAAVSGPHQRAPTCARCPRPAPSTRRSAAGSPASPCRSRSTGCRGAASQRRTGSHRARGGPPQPCVRTDPPPRHRSACMYRQQLSQTIKRGGGGGGGR
jgi:hypothetical protein